MYTIIRCIQRIFKSPEFSWLSSSKTAKLDIRFSNIRPKKKVLLLFEKTTFSTYFKFFIFIRIKNINDCGGEKAGLGNSGAWFETL